LLCITIDEEKIMITIHTSRRCHSLSLSRRSITALVLLFCLGTLGLGAPTDNGATIESDVVYGYTDGVALIMDVIRPPRNHSNHRALIGNASGGWRSSRKGGVLEMAHGIAQADGYTVFVVMHGSQPRYTIDEIVPQMVRAVRFVRHSAAKYGIDPDRIGDFGFSSGGHLALMMGLLGNEGKKDAADPVERESSRLQAVVAFFPPTDFMNYGRPGNVQLGTDALKSYRSAFFHYPEPKAGEEVLGPKISPITFVKKTAPPILLFHGDQDPLVPIQQSRIFLAAMKKAGATCELQTRPGAKHGWGGKQQYDDIRAMLAWFDRYLGPEKPSGNHNHEISGAAEAQPKKTANLHE
jgi:acetyl esterase/lipase